jgi:hypothetical protein
MAADPHSAAALGERLGLSDEELCATLDADPLMLVSSQADHRPDLQILNALLDDAELQVSSGALRRWVRTQGPSGRPLDMLLTRDFAAFEDALSTLRTRGFVVGGEGSEG